MYHCSYWPRLTRESFPKDYNPRPLSFITRELAEWNYLDGSKTLSHSCPIGLQPRRATPDTEQTQMLTGLPLPLLTKVTCFLTAIYWDWIDLFILFCYNLSNHVSLLSRQCDDNKSPQDVDSHWRAQKDGEVTKLVCFWAISLHPLQGAPQVLHSSLCSLWVWKWAFPDRK